MLVLQLDTSFARSPSSRKAGIEILAKLLTDGITPVAFLTEGGD